MTKYIVDSKWKTRAGKIVMVTRVTGDVVYCDDARARWADTGVGNRMFDQDIDLISPVSDERLAIDLLKSLGYEVVEPKPKLSGKIVIYSHFGHIHAYTEHSWKSYGYDEDTKGRTVLAVLDWTEGDGLEKSTEKPAEPDGSFQAGCVPDNRLTAAGGASMAV